MYRDEKFQSIEQNLREEISEDAIIIRLTDRGYLTAQFASGCDFFTEGCDAAVDYTYYDKAGKEIDGGQMDYCSDEMCYDGIMDAVPHVIMFALDLSKEMIPTYQII